MDLQVRKIHFVQEFLRVNNEKIIAKLEDILKSEKIKLYANNPTPYTIDELNLMIDNAEDDAENNRMKNIQDLKNDIKTWI
jgi:hypothetical protein